VEEHLLLIILEQLQEELEIHLQQVHLKEIQVEIVLVELIHLMQQVEVEELLL
jgi:hypothetical protein